jgi:hypothetical protein
VEIKSSLAKLQEAANEKLQAKISEIATALEDDYRFVLSYYNIWLDGFSKV